MADGGPVDGGRPFCRQLPNAANPCSLRSGTDVYVSFAYGLRGGTFALSVRTITLIYCLYCFIIFHFRQRTSTRGGFHRHTEIEASKSQKIAVGRNRWQWFVGCKKKKSGRGSFVASSVRKISKFADQRAGGMWWNLWWKFQAFRRLKAGRW